MGLADFKARLLLFFARKLREWANSIDENIPSPGPPGSVVTEEGESEQPSTRIAGGPPQHWIDLVRERAPELLSLIQDYSSEERPLPKDHVHTYRSERDNQTYRFETDDEPYRSQADDEVKLPDQKIVNLPRVKEDVVRKSEPEASPPKRVVEKRKARSKLWSVLPGSKPLTLRPLSEPSSFLQPSSHDNQRVEPPPQRIEVYERHEEIVESPAQSSRSVVKGKDQLVTRESVPQAGPQEPRSDEAPAATYGTPKPRATLVSAAKPEAPVKLDVTRTDVTRTDVTRKLQVQQPALKAVRKTQSKPRRYLQAIINITRKTLRRTVRAVDQSSHAITRINLSVTANTPTNLSVNSSLKHSSSTSNVVSFEESSKAQRAVKYETSYTPITQRSEKKAVTVAPRLKTPDAAVRRVSPPIRPKASPPIRPKASPPIRPTKNLMTAWRQSPPVAAPRPVRPADDASNARIQDAFGNMPALMDEDRMNRASSVHLADLRPGKNQWPDLPSETSTEVADEWAAHQRDLNRMRRLKEEQRGTPWNE